MPLSVRGQCNTKPSGAYKAPRNQNDVDLIYGRGAPGAVLIGACADAMPACIPGLHDLMIDAAMMNAGRKIEIYVVK